jgi:hypothetical protein
VPRLENGVGLYALEGPLEETTGLEKANAFSESDDMGQEKLVAEGGNGSREFGFRGERGEGFRGRKGAL